MMFDYRAMAQVSFRVVKEDMIFVWQQEHATSTTKRDVLE